LPKRVREAEIGSSEMDDSLVGEILTKCIPGDLKKRPPTSSEWKGWWSMSDYCFPVYYPIFSDETGCSR